MIHTLENPIIDYVKDFILSVESVIIGDVHKQIETVISDDMYEWANKGSKRTIKSDQRITSNTIHQSVEEIYKEIASKMRQLTEEMHSKIIIEIIQQFMKEMNSVTDNYMNQMIEEMNRVMIKNTQQFTNETNSIALITRAKLNAMLQLQKQ